MLRSAHTGWPEASSRPMRSPSSRATNTCGMRSISPCNRIRVTVEDVVLARGDKRDGLGFSLHRGSRSPAARSNTRRKDRPRSSARPNGPTRFCRKCRRLSRSPPALPLPTSTTGTCLAGASAGAHATDTHAHGNVDGGICLTLGSSAADGAHRHFGRALGPGIRDRESFGVNAVGPGDFERAVLPTRSRAAWRACPARGRRFRRSVGAGCF